MPKVALLVTCVADQVFPDTAVATVRVLEAAGAEVVFPASQTCCGQPALTAGEPEALRRELTYFSVVTLTTTGFGDITAVHPVARTLVMLEALVGQLYPAIILAWLVSLAIMHQKEKP